MSVIRGCQEGRVTPKLVEVYCPKCGEIMEVFVRMGGGIDQTGRLSEPSKCEKCGFVAEADTALGSFKSAE